MEKSNRPPSTSTPVVICGGFLSFALLYEEMRETLQTLIHQPVVTADLGSGDWLAAMAPPGWVLLLDKLGVAVKTVLYQTGADRVTIVGHSAGGVLARLYLSPRPFFGHTYGGQETVAQLITLGSPHYNRQKKLFGSWMSRWIERRYPGAAFAPEVRYTAVVGKLIHGRQEGNLRERHAYGFYQDIGGQGETWGDGLVPLNAALLKGAQQIVLEGVGHFTGFGGPWYGEPAVIRRWWPVTQNNEGTPDVGRAHERSSPSS